VKSQELLKAVEALPAQWHGAGSLKSDVLRRLIHYVSQLDVKHSLETGTGKSTLLFSHFSSHHIVFAKDDAGDGDSLRVVGESPILRRSAVQFVIGPTQITLPRYEFRNTFQLALIDGPHGYPFPDLEYYFIYPHLDQDSLLIIDDINIPTVFNLFKLLSEDQMFELLEVVGTTAFFKRTTAELFDPLGDGWWLQEYNRRRFPIQDNAIHYSMIDKIKGLAPRSVKALIKKAVKLV